MKKIFFYLLYFLFFAFQWNKCLCNCFWLASDLNQKEEGNVLRTQSAKVFSVSWLKEETHVDIIETTALSEMQARSRVLKKLKVLYKARNWA